MSQWWAKWADRSTVIDCAERDLFRSIEKVEEWAKEVKRNYARLDLARRAKDSQFSRGTKPTSAGGA